MDRLFKDARTHSNWLDKPVTDELLRDVFALAVMGPTSFNCLPMRVLFLRNKEKLYPALSPGNLEKTKNAPVTAIIGMDLEFYQRLPELFPPFPNAQQIFSTDQDLAEKTAFRNSSLQGGYFIIAARSLGLDCGPMSGFDNNMVDETFFSDTSIKSNFLCNLGYGDHSKLHPPLPKLSFSKACRIL